VVPEHTCTADGGDKAGSSERVAEVGLDWNRQVLGDVTLHDSWRSLATAPAVPWEPRRSAASTCLLISWVLGGALAVPNRRLHHARNTLEGQLGAPAVNSTGAGQTSQLMPCSLHRAGTSWTDSLGSPAAIGRLQYTRRDMRRTACLGCKQAGAAGTAAGGRAGRRTRSSRRQRWPAAGVPRG